MERQSQRQRHSRHTEIESGFVPFLILIDKKIQRMYHSGPLGLLNHSRKEKAQRCIIMAY